MFGTSSRNDSNSQDNNSQGVDEGQYQAAMSAPSLPTMGGSSSFGSSQFGSQNSSQNSFSTEDTSHMISDHSTSGISNESQQYGNNSGISSDLVDIKQQALQQLSPLVPHLEQTAEEKFRTTMMMIQATDDQSLLKTAFEAAQKIEDDKARAQALLDVINEINYFTQQNK